MPETDEGPATASPRQGHGAAEGSESKHDVDDLDMERRRLMARNRAKLIALGISVGVMELKDLAKQRTTHRQRPSKPKHREPVEPSRRSTRLAGGSGDAATGAEPLMQLGDDGGAEVQGAEPRPRSSRPGAGEELLGLSEEEIAARAEQLRAREATRLRELELEGLVDFSPEAAVFVVIGSTGNHYTVRLSDAKRSCQCIDCRVRKRDCKHIRLILRKLQIQDNPGQWQQAVERCFHAAAGGGAADGARLEQSPAAPEASGAHPAPQSTEDVGGEAAAADDGTQPPTAARKQGGRKRTRTEAPGARSPKVEVARETRASRKRGSGASGG